MDEDIALPLILGGLLAAVIAVWQRQILAIHHASLENGSLQFADGQEQEEEGGGKRRRTVSESPCTRSLLGTSCWPHEAS